MDALLTLSSKGQLVIPARLRQLLGLQAGDRLALSLEPDGLHLVPQAERESASAHELIGCVNYLGRGCAPGVHGSRPLCQSGCQSGRFMSLPIALDTNLLVRLLTNDDPRRPVRWRI